jgi:arylsulfate sulfotransferase
MIRPSPTRKLIIACLMSATLFIPLSSRATIITSEPTFTPSSNAPLAGVLALTTAVPSRISALVSDGTNTWEKDFYDFGTTHSEVLLGFEPGRTNQILVTAYDQNQNAYTAPQPVTFVTAPLPSNFPPWTVLKSEPSQMEPGYTLFMISSGTAYSYITIMDNSGQVVWYRPWTYDDSDVRQLADGNLFIEQQNSLNNFVEMNMLGDIVNILNAPKSYPVNPHEGFVTDHGTILYLSDVSETVSNFPSAVNPPPNTNYTLVTRIMDDNPVVEISATDGALSNAWSPLTMLDPTHVTYLTYSYSSIYGVDNEHANAIVEDTNDNNSIIVSMRNQNAVFKFTRSGQLKWILSPHPGWGTNWQQYLLTPVSTPFDWNYGQHAPMLTPQGTLLLYNDNIERASPFDPPVPDQDNYSSAVEYNINETNMTVSEVWNSAWQTNQDRLFTTIVGKAQWLPQTRDVLVTYGYVTYVNGVHPSPYSANATMVRLIEYTHDPVPQIVFDVSIFDTNNTSKSYVGDFCYRATRIPDLYAHPDLPVTDLTVSDQDNLPLLEFSADPTHSYVVQASTDLTNWTTIGPAFQNGGVGNFDFRDLNADQFTTRFYRVVSQ